MTPLLMLRPRSFTTTTQPPPPRLGALAAPAVLPAIAARRRVRGTALSPVGRPRGYDGVAAPTNRHHYRHLHRHCHCERFVRDLMLCLF